MADGTPTEGLAERVRQGDRAAELELVEFFHEKVRAIALARTRDPEAARDLAQEVMLAVLCNLRDGRLNNPAGLAGYVAATARNRINSFFRTQRVVRAHDPPPSFVQEQPDPEQRLEEAERRQRARQAIERLRASDREILRLTLVEGLRSREIAARLGLKGELVRKRKSRAIRKARQAMRR